MGTRFSKNTTKPIEKEVEMIEVTSHRVVFPGFDVLLDDVEPLYRILQYDPTVDLEPIDQLMKIVHRKRVETILISSSPPESEEDVFSEHIIW